MNSNALLQQIENGQEEHFSPAMLLTRGVHQVMPENGLLEKMLEGPIRLYLGIDPTAPDLHIGHLVPLRKLRQFQALGHNVILLFGTFTGMIGDPTDKGATRTRLTPEQVSTNVATYREQAGKVLNLTDEARNPITVVYNHEWLEPLNFAQIIELAANFTLGPMLTRSPYRERLEAGSSVYLHELMYPLMQGFDSVALEVDLEVGGKDQIPNMLAGRTLMQSMLGHEKWVMGMKLIESPDGTKMGKTSGSVVNIMEWPEVIYAAIMGWPDAAIPLGLELLTLVPTGVVNDVDKQVKKAAEGDSHAINPMLLKEALAYRVILELNGPNDAEFARQVFDDVMRKKQLPPRIKQVTTETGMLSDILVAVGLARDTDHALSLISQKAIYIDGQKLSKNVSIGTGNILVAVGKRTISNIREVQVE